MNKLIIIIFILLTHSFSSFGSPNGKGLICKCSIECEKTEPNFQNYLKNNRYFIIYPKKQSKSWFYELNNDIVEVRAKPISIKRNENYLIINDYYEVNRKTLEMKYKGDKQFQKYYWCKVYTPKQFAEDTKYYQNQFQYTYNSLISKNKI